MAEPRPPLLTTPQKQMRGPPIQIGSLPGRDPIPQSHRYLARLLAATILRLKKWSPALTLWVCDPRRLGSRSLSVNAQLAATAMRLRQARESDDVIQIQAALKSVPDFELADDNSLFAEVHDLATELRQRIVEDVDLAHLDMLRRSRELKYRIRRLWDLMVAESDMIRDEVEAAGAYAIGKRGTPHHAHIPLSTSGARALVPAPCTRPC